VKSIPLKWLPRDIYKYSFALLPGPKQTPLFKSRNPPKTEAKITQMAQPSGSKDPGSRVKSGIQEAARTKTIKNACAHAITTMHSTVETAQQISSLSQCIQVREGIKAGTLHVQMAIKSSPSW
jgi:hypothetical protein